MKKRKSIKSILFVDEFLELGGELKTGMIIFTHVNQNRIFDGTPYSKDTKKYTVVKYDPKSGIYVEELADTVSLGTGWTFVEVEICLNYTKRHVSTVIDSSNDNASGGFCL